MNSLQDRFLSESIRSLIEQVIVRIAIGAFAIHLFLIFLVDWKLLRVEDPSGLLRNPIVAIYTPFSFILVYEVYLLVYYLPKSISKYVGKQYEIITLIIIRRIFKDIAKLDLQVDWFSVTGNYWFTYDITAAVILFLLILIFYRLNDAKESLTKLQNQPVSPSISRFIQTKRLIAACLVPLFLVLAVLIKFTFGVDGLLDVLLTIGAVLIGVVILAIHNEYEKLTHEQTR